MTISTCTQTNYFLKRMSLYAFRCNETIFENSQAETLFSIQLVYSILFLYLYFSDASAWFLSLS